MIKELTAAEQLEEILQTSKQRPVLLFKHSTSCLTSASAWREFQRFAEAESRPEYWRLLVIERRALARLVAQQTAVRHESPQTLLLYNGKTIWHESHRRISFKALQKSLEMIPSAIA